ncbi:MAG: class I SAM-dependent methyltransferase [Desulforhopalus sp.]
MQILQQLRALHLPAGCWSSSYFNCDFMLVKGRRVNFTGEFFVPGISGERVEADHFERYRFACNFAKGKSILDIACGVGYSAPLFIEVGASSYDGVDLGEKQIDYAKRHYGSDNVKFHVDNICTYNGGKSYDLITCFETIEHVDNYLAALENLFSLLKPGGMLIISSPNRLATSPKALSISSKPSNKYHAQEFIPEELVLILQDQGFSVGQDDVYGQRQGRIFRSKIMQKIANIAFGNPKHKASPTIAPITNKVPRYFVVVAKK